jgi:hypothetical protein
MLKLTDILFAGALVVWAMPVLAVDLPDYGSKNFSPSGDTPSYFANEAAPVSARTADTTERDWSAVDEMAPARPAFEGTRSAHAHRGRYGRYAVAQTSSRHGSGRYGGKAAGPAHNSAALTGNIGKRPALATGGRASAASAARTTAKHGRPSARHAGVGMASYMVN